ncbi:uncharacterized protein LOC125680071 [Ostrea edulis]|uniref:uncharacterized protein LOC125680071 n=1 Tax=Ostrea edulis TaxID=37623 RepID=UPI0024AF9FDF|nr:uncharacterized protein LOC125680071 [Ostrea edulis]
MSITIITEMFLPIIVVLPSLRNGLTSNENGTLSKPAYMGLQWLQHYIVFSELKTWLEARDVCRSVNGVLQFYKWNSVNWYIKTKAGRAGWPTNHDIWLGMTKDKNSEIWYTVRSTKCIERNFTISGHNHSERQCAILNMSVSSHADTDNMIYADSCDAQLLGFACLVPKGRIPKDVDVYPMSKVVEKGYKRKRWNVSSEEECAINSFSVFHCYAATYFPEDEYCVAECTQMTSIPETVILVNSSINSTVLLRTHNKVSINHIVSTKSSTISDQYPCVYESTTTNTPIVFSTIDTTTTGVKKVTNHTANTPMFYNTTTDNPSQCHCICSTNSGNITTEALNQKISEIKRTLTVNKTSLSSTVRKKTSAPDSRTSSAGMGVLGICLIIILITALVASDLFCFISFLKSLI